MKRTTLALALLLALPLAAAAQDASSTDTAGDAGNGGWSGSGEFGYAAARGNSRSENLNAKLGLSKETDVWKDNFFLTALRAKGDTSVTTLQNGQVVSEDRYTTTANRYDAGASLGYKYSPRAYLVGALRYAHDDFAANRWQAALSLGFGYIALKNGRTELSFEIAPGYKRYRPADFFVTDATVTPPVTTLVRPGSKGEPIVRGLANWKYRLTASTRFEDTVLVEAGTDNRYAQNDAGLAVSMTEKLALKIGYQVRYNSDTTPGTKSTDQLWTTNLVYSF
ncbi:putative salt-induced outer membrane protein [Mizugakiibacter sediminis]|uniref:Membrane protein n=1 Tax=Mizugakiibacter sediminis TaxID=1475481 RepID=A0A0K8QKZ5_9GAMM|nr:DUF481 domain-containing protein [Mizugakiibacter sediminis]GAP65538.1 putative salt-induced outer membrane protein [Mizugakiibacter sediminis]